MHRWEDDGGVILGERHCSHTRRLGAVEHGCLPANQRVSTSRPISSSNTLTPRFTGDRRRWALAS